MTLQNKLNEYVEIYKNLLHQHNIDDQVFRDKYLKEKESE